MLKIRFQRTGRKNDPAYRMVVIEHSASPRAGKNVATVGSYHPKTKETVINADEVKKWLGHGAQASGTVHNLLVSKGIIEGDKVNVLPQKTPIVKEKEEEKVEEKTEAPTEAEVEAEVTEEEGAAAEEAPAEDASNDEAPEEEPKAEEAPAEEPAPEEEKKEEAA